MSNLINFASPTHNNQFLKKKIITKISDIISNGKYILGNSVKIFEKNISKYLKVKYAIAVNSGTDAIISSLLCIDVKENDEILVPSHTATATIASIKLLGAKPIFIDINLSNYTVKTSKICSLVTKKTKAIIGVHIYGHPCNNLEINKICRKYKIFFIEDCAQSIGSELNKKKLGVFGDFGCFSFFPTKNLSAIGDAGVVVTNNRNYYLKLLKIRQYGWNQKRVSVVTGLNSRCDEIQAAILNIKIKFLDTYISKRIAIAKFYEKKLKHLPILLPKTEKNCKHSYHLYVIRVKKSIRPSFIKYMRSKNIFLGIHYDPPTHKMPNFLSSKNFNLVNTEKISKEIVSLPIYPELSVSNLNKICKTIESFFVKFRLIK